MNALLVEEEALAASSSSVVATYIVKEQAEEKIILFEAPDVNEELLPEEQEPFREVVLVTPEGIREKVEALGIVQVTSEAGICYSGKEGADIIRLEENVGNNCIVETAKGNDIIIVQGGNNHVLKGAQGNDRFAFGELEAEGSYVVDQTDSLGSDRDILSLLEYTSGDFAIECTNGVDLLLKHLTTEAIITIKNWHNNPLKYIVFQDGRLKLDQLGEALGQETYKLKLQGEYGFAGNKEVEAYSTKISGNGETLALKGNSNYVVVNTGDFCLVEGDGNIITSKAEANNIIIKAGTGNVVECETVATVTISEGQGNQLHFSADFNKLVVEAGELEELTNKGTLEILLPNASLTLKNSGISVLKIEDNKVYIEGGRFEKLLGSKENDTLVVTDGTIGVTELETSNLLVVNKGSVAYLRGGSGEDRYILNSLQAGQEYVLDQASDSEGSRQVEGDLLVLSNYDSEAFGFELDQEHNLLLALKEQNSVIKVQGWADNPFSQVQFRDKTVTLKELSERLHFNPIYSQQEVIRTFIETLDHYKGKLVETLDVAVRECSKGLYESAQEWVDSFIQDIVQYGGKTYDDAQAFLKRFCGIDLSNADTGAISGYDAMGPVVKDKESVVKEKPRLTLEGLVYDYTDKIVARDIFTGSDREFTCATVNCAGKPFTFYWDDGEFDTLAEMGLVANREVLEKMMGCIIEGWAEPIFDLIYESYGVALTEAGSKVKVLENGNPGMRIVLDYVSESVKSPITVNNAPSNLGAMYNVERWELNDAGRSVLNQYQLIALNTYRFRGALEDMSGKPGRYSSTAQYIDRVLAHEMVHATLHATIDNYGMVPRYIQEGLGELIQGVDDHRKYDMFDIVSNNVYISGKDADHEQYLQRIFTLKDLNYIYGTESYGGSYALLRYLAKQVADYSLEQASGVGLTNKELVQLQSSEVSFVELPLNNAGLACYAYEDKEASLPHLFGNI